MPFLKIKSGGGAGYIAGSNDGIVTVAGRPAKRELVILDAKKLSIISKGVSLDNGHYIFTGLSLSKEYLLMVRDYKKEFEPFAWDYVKPADDLTVAEQKALRASFQTT